MELLREEGFVVVQRSAGSKGIVDVFAVADDEVRLVQVKYTKSKDNGFWDQNCGKLERLKVPDRTTKYLYVYRFGRRGPEVIAL